jgi:uncharacterized protein (DUF305 family)
MMTTSFLIMYGVMFLNVDKPEHVYISTTRVYMTLLMVAPMAVVMLGFMWKMYENIKVNVIILVISAVIFVAAFFLLRSQSLIGDVQYLKGMIPHHSSAILNSEEATLRDPEVKQLAEEIIKAQEEEIAKMKAILERLEH